MAEDQETSSAPDPLTRSAEVVGSALGSATKAVADAAQGAADTARSAAASAAGGAAAAGSAASDVASGAVAATAAPRRALRRTRQRTVKAANRQVTFDEGIQGASLLGMRLRRLVGDTAVLGKGEIFVPAETV